MGDRHTALWIWAGMVYGTAGTTLWTDLKTAGAPEDLYDALTKGEICSSKDVMKRVGETALESAVKIMEQAESAGHGILCADSPQYPAKLREMKDAPPVLYYYGDIGALEGRVVLDVVGARDCSEYSETMCGLICEGLIRRGAVLMSGFANGIDQRVCRTALEKGSPPVVVYPYNLDVVHPPETGELKRQVAENGLIISEYHIGYRAVNAFYRRNKLMSYLSDAVLFIEGSRESHGLDRCERARKLGKPVLALPPCDITDPRYSGQIKLLRKGHRPLFSDADVVFALQRAGNNGLGTLTDEGGGDGAVMSAPKRETAGRKLPARKNETETNIPSGSRTVPQEVMEGLTEIQRRLCQELMKRPLHYNDMSEITGLSMAEFLPQITELELMGIVTSDFNGLFSIK